jgi:hypothetical protein
VLGVVIFYVGRDGGTEMCFGQDDNVGALVEGDCFESESFG